MTLLYRDANSATVPVATSPASAGELAPLHAAASLVLGVATPVSQSNPMPVEVAAGSPALDGSGTVAAGAAAQILFGGMTPSNGFMVANNSSSQIYVSDVGIATNGGASLPIAPGTVFATPTGYRPAGAVSLYGGTTGQAFAARRW